MTLVRSTIALVAMLVCFAASSFPVPAFGQGADYDVNHDGVITSLDVDTVIDHLNAYGTTDVFDDFIAEFGNYADSTLEDDIESAGAETILPGLALYFASSADQDRTWYHVAWERNDANRSGTISSLDALVIINYLN